MYTTFLLFMIEMKIDLSMKQSNFLFLLGPALKLQFACSVYSHATPITTETQLFSNVFTGYVISCKQSLQKSAKKECLQGTSAA